MISKAMLLDCTLRDGAYLVDKTFGESTIRGIINGLIKARIDCIEIGFFQDEGFGEGKTVFVNSADAKRFIPQNKNGVLFTVLADCSRYSLSNLDNCDGNSVDAIRECFFKSERKEAINNCKIIIEKGYKCFVQPVDILGYSDSELIEFIDEINKIEPYCLSIVDTFGSMYQDDLHRIFELINHNLVSTCKIGFHSHNNMQLSNALSQELLRISYGKREIVIDGTISGMGRGAGNTPIELIAQYMTSRLGYNYEIDAILDVIDDYMDNIRTKCNWGYTTPFFIAGCYSAHVNNVEYLTQKNSIRSKDMRFILNKLGVSSRKRYDYNLLEKTYVNYISSEIDDQKSITFLKKIFKNRNVVILVPGKSLLDKTEKIKKIVFDESALVISINFIHDIIPSDYLYISNTRRYSAMSGESEFVNLKKIITSNIKRNESENELVISFKRLVKCGWQHIDNSAIMLLRLLDEFEIKSIQIAGFDGYSVNEIQNYINSDLELATVRDNPIQLNDEIESMLQDYKETRNRNTPICFITKSRFSRVFE